MDERPIIIRVYDQDNVAIVANANGLPQGTQLADGTVLRDYVPFGHKLLLTNLEKDAAIIRYGQVIGYTIRNVQRGSWINESLIRLPQAPALQDIKIGEQSSKQPVPLDGYTFEGFRNNDGTVGTKNVLGILTSVQCVAGTTNHLIHRIKTEILPRYRNVDDVVAINHTYGCGVAIDSPAAIIPVRTLRNIGRNPNFGGEMMVIGLGCEKLSPETLLQDQVNLAGEQSSIFRLQDKSNTGFSSMIASLMEMAEKRLQRLNLRHRQTCPASDLIVGMQCGGSDAFSGITANPAAGYAADMIVRAGGTVMFSEVTEVRDAIHLLVERVLDETVRTSLLREMEWYDQYLQMGGVDRSANPAPGNKEGGLSNIVEKALGSFIKSGTSPIVDVLAPGERVRRNGLVFAATPASDFICGTLQLAAGMNVQVFTTGRGTPYGLSMVPVLKVSTNTPLRDRWYDLIDIDAGRIATGEATIADVGMELFQMILDVASGKKQTAADRLGLHNDIVLFNPGPVT
ncbi:MAG TPA: galactarate dehydratase [Syntrophorhabdaceae bacterium]|nr:galactarate dehydratase [Syntrophorhabdaceae bacterium]